MLNSSRFSPMRPLRVRYALLGVALLWAAGCIDRQHQLPQQQDNSPHKSNGELAPNRDDTPRNANSPQESNASEATITPPANAAISPPSVASSPPPASAAELQRDSPVVEVELVEARSGMVVSVSPYASQAGVEILQAGGTAVDAAVATALVLAVVFPEAGNIGGGGFMMIHPADGRPPMCVDYRETAPAASTPQMYQPEESRLGHRAVGVPGTIRGLALAHQHYGRLPWKDLVQPAIRLAEAGFVLDEYLARTLGAMVRQSDNFAELQRVYGKEQGRADWRPGDRLVLPDLARTLARLAEHGPDEFYRGETAEQIALEMERGGGLVTRDDLDGYTARLREPIHGTYRGFDVYGPPPPSSGGICLVQMLNVLEHFDLARQGRWSAETLHQMTEAMKRAYRDRARYLGDADFVDIPDHLTTKQYARRLAAEIRADRATPSEQLAEGIELAGEPDSTTHFSIVDRHGMAVANTYTLEHSYGSRVVVAGGGFLLNNEMSDFNWRPGQTDRQGAIGTPANVIAPGKRMLSSQTPTIVARDGKPVLVTGSPGGRTIINTVLCVVLNVLEFEMPLDEAVGAARMHHGWLPDRLRIERRDDARWRAAADALAQLGHHVEPAARQGDAHSIAIGDRLYGAADRRIVGSARGY